MKKDVINQLLNYQPFNCQEEKDKETILFFLNNFDDIFDRSNLIAHITSSCWLVNQNCDRAIMAYHNLYDSYSWLGGHNDGETDLLKVAIKEAKEESGLVDITPLSNDIFSIEVLSVNQHIKKGVYVPAHLHLNFTFLLQASDHQELKVKEDENSSVKWFTLEEAVKVSNEKAFRDFIYNKMNKKLELFLSKGGKL